MKITTKWMTHPRDSAKQLFLPSIVSVSVLVALAALLYGLGGENPVGPVTSFLSSTWEALSPLALFMITVWIFHLVSYLLVGSFAKDLSIVARATRRLGRAFWRRFFSSWTGPALLRDLTPSLSQVCLFRRCLPSWLATGWRPGDSVQLE